MPSKGGGDLPRVGTLTSLFIILLSLAAFSGQTQGQQSRVDPRTISPNQAAPDLYSDKLSLKITLMNLPGAKQAASYWQAEYKVYFVAEADFEKIVRQLRKEGKNRDLKPEYFPNKTLLAEGSVNKNKLTTLQERTFVRDGIEFKRKIPAAQQTSFSSILSFYSVKIYDSELKKSIYRSDVFIVPPFDDDSSDRSTFQPRSYVYLNFYVATDGSLNTSNRKSASETTEWKPY
jgi:hypothetical protein